MANPGKQYGLLVPKKSGQGLQPRPSIFGDDSESDSGEGGNAAPKSFKNESVQKRQTKLDIKKALEQDPTVYQYDEVYDEMEQKKIEQKNQKKDPEKRPKYIEALLATAERRKREQERRTERKVQKEREAEGEEFKDKESFVTSAYRKKLEEFEAMDEQEKMLDRIEELTDVAKQNDLGGFYRHLYKQTVGGDEVKPAAVTVKEEKDSSLSPVVEQHSNDEPEDPVNSQEVSAPAAVTKVEERRYRKRKVSSSSESECGDDLINKKVKVEDGTDGDSDSSSSESSSESSSDSSSKGSGDEGNDKSKKQKDTADVKKDSNKSNEVKETDKKPNESDCNKVNGVTEEKTEEKVSESNKDEVAVEKPPEEPKPNIWEKKTVGPVFEAALQRYMARKAARLARSCS